MICSLPFSSPIKCASSINMLCELVSKLPPNCGDVSSTTLAKSLLEPVPAITVLLVIFLRPPPDVSTAKKTSSSV